jgi:prolyl-tRNA editing enzyme YbaK/EbsC (Cys-tRNA(Pro) deacylase)
MKNESKGAGTMAIEKVKTYFAQWGLEDKILEFTESSATVALAAAALHCEPGRIAKTLSFKKDDSAILLVTAGDKKIDNAKFKAAFHMKPKMLPPEEVLALVGHGVGGVCPFAIPTGIAVYTDQSLRRFVTVFPACGSSNSAIELTPEDLYLYSQSQGWVDVSQD